MQLICTIQSTYAQADSFCKKVCFQYISSALARVIAYLNLHLRGTESDKWHRFSLTIPPAHKRQSLVLGSQYHYRFTAVVTHNNSQKQRSLESCLRVSLKEFTLGMKSALYSTQLSYGSYYTKREKYGLLSHWKYMPSRIERSTEASSWQKKFKRFLKKEDKRYRDKKAYFKAPKWYHFA